MAEYPWLFWMNNGNLFLFGPLFYFFIRAAHTGRFIAASTFILHLIPFVLIKSGTLILGPTELGETLLPPVFFIVLNYTLTAHGTLYALLSLSVAYKNKRTNTSSMNTWAFWLAVIYAGGWIFSFLARQYESVNAPLSTLMWTIAYMTLASMIYVISVKLMIYKGGEDSGAKSKKSISHVRTDNDHKYKRSMLKPDERKRLAVALKDALVKEQLYLDPELSRAKLAEYLQVSPHTLSQLLNNHFHKSFSDYVNEYRLEEAKRKLIDPSYQRHTILSIAFESGFSSKSSFQRLFKKFMGKTPSQYLEEMKAHSGE